VKALVPPFASRNGGSPSATRHGGNVSLSERSFEINVFVLPSASRHDENHKCESILCAYEETMVDYVMLR
jgi:hypothetical protein